MSLRLTHLLGIFCCCYLLLTGCSHGNGCPPQTPRLETNFASLVLKVIQQKMPTGGGYSGSKETVNALVDRVVLYREDSGKLHLQPHKAQPSFCSGACYLVLLQALQEWEQISGLQIPPEAWLAFNISTDQPDGCGVWGRANANGPGFAKLISDVGAGINFTDVNQARAGDFLKFFWTPEIGGAERGHLVVFLGTEQHNGQLMVKFWSSNMPDGYGTKSVPMEQMHHLIFTRITAPHNFRHVTRLSDSDPWLEAMLTHRFSFAEVIRKCKIQVSQHQK